MKSLGKRMGIFCLMLAMTTGCSFSAMLQGPYEQGISALDQEKYEEAKTHFYTAIEDGKKEKEAYIGLGAACVGLGDCKEAKKAFQKAIKKGAPLTGVLATYLGDIAMEEDRYDEALSYYKVALEKGELTKEVVKQTKRNQVVANERLGNFEEAKKLLDAYIKEYPSDKRVLKEAEFLKSR